MRRLFGMTRDYYLLLLGYFISSVGNWLYQLALPLLVYELTNSPLSMAVTYGLAYLPYVLFLPIGGVIADRVNRQRLLVVGDFISALVCGLLALAVWQGITSMLIIYPAVFILAGVTPLYHSAFQVWFLVLLINLTWHAGIPGFKAQKISSPWLDHSWAAS